MQPEGHLRVLTDSLRAKHAVEWRDGVVEDRRYEYFRGKDFATYFKQHPEKFSSWIPDKSGEHRTNVHNFSHPLQLCLLRISFWLLDSAVS